jgi:hypothetical protein
MEDFLENRLVVSSADAPVVLGGTMTRPVAGPVPFGTLRREPARSAKASGASPPPAKPAEPAPSASSAPETHTETTAHGTRVQTIVERGRVTKIVVTCSCGKVTELDCTY